MNIIEYLKPFNPQIIFEFGSYDAADTLRYKRAFMQAKVYGFEPDPMNYGTCVTRVEREGLVIVFSRCAIMDFTGTTDFYPTRKGEAGGYSGSVLKHTKYHVETQRGVQRVISNPIKIPCTTIDDFCKDKGIAHIDFMHVDVEGVVDRVLAGCKRVRPEHIFAEVRNMNTLYEGCRDEEAFNKVFEEAGYQLVARMGETIIYIR